MLRCFKLLTLLLLLSPAIGFARGVPLERVSVLLGRSSIRVTERHYAPWTRSRQDQLEADLAKAWSMDPVALLEPKGTSGVRGESAKIN